MRNIFYFFLIAAQGFSSVLTGDYINNICKEKIQSLINDGRIEIAEREIDDIILPDGTFTLEAKASLSFQNAFVDIKIFVNSKEYKRIRYYFKIKRFKNVVVCLKEIRAKETITEDMIGIEEREITNISNYIEKIEDVVSKEAKRRIREGNIILSDYIKEKPLINFGDIVTIIKNGKGFSIKAKGIAISRGCKGEKVSVRNLSSQKIVEAIVIDRGRVEVR